MQSRRPRWIAVDQIEWRLPLRTLCGESLSAIFPARSPRRVVIFPDRQITPAGWRLSTPGATVVVADLRSACADFPAAFSLPGRAVLPAGTDLTGRRTSGKPAARIRLNHPKPRRRCIESGSHRCEVGAGHRHHPSITLDRDHLRGPALQSLAGHHTAAAAQIEPTATRQLRRQQVEDGLAHPCSRWAGGGPRWTLQPTAAAEAQRHDRGSDRCRCTQSSQRCSIASPTGPDFSGWN